MGGMFSDPACNASASAFDNALVATAGAVRLENRGAGLEIEAQGTYKF